MSRKRSKKGYRKTSEFAVQALGKGPGATEERVPAGVCRNTSTAARVKEERIVLEKDSGSKRRVPESARGRHRFCRPEAGTIIVGSGEESTTSAGTADTSVCIRAQQGL